MYIHTEDVELEAFSILTPGLSFSDPEAVRCLEINSVFACFSIWLEIFNTEVSHKRSLV